MINGQPLTLSIPNVTEDFQNLYSFPSSSLQPVTVTTGVPTAVTDVSARTEPCVTPSLELVSALLDIKAGAVRPSVKLALMEMDANRNVSARMVLSVIM